MRKLWTPPGVPQTSVNEHSLGARLGPRVAKVITDAQEYSLWKTGGMRASQHRDGLTLFWQDIGKELSRTITPVFRDIASHPDIHPKVKDFAEFLARQPGEGAAIAGTLVATIAYSTGISQLIADLAAPVIQDLLSKDPNLILSPDTWVALAARRLAPMKEAQSWMAKMGYSADMTEWGYKAALAYPDISVLFTQRNRGVIDDKQLVQGLRNLAYPEDIIGKLVGLHRTLLSPADAADLVLKGWIPQKKGEEIASASGVDAEDFHLLTLDTGEPPGTMQMLEAFRRGFIDQATLAKGIRESRVRDEWIPMLEKLRYVPMDTSDAARAVVQGYMSQAEADHIAQLNGLEPGFMKTVTLIQGEPPGRMEMLGLFNRGLISEAVVKQSFRESHMKDKYIGTAMLLRRKFLSEPQIMRGLQYDALTDTEAIKLLQDEGYVEHDAKIVVHTGRNAALGRHKVYAESQALDLYKEWSISEEELRDLLKYLNYTKDSIDLIVQIADFQRTATDINKAVGVVQKGYIGRHFEKEDAKDYLKQLGIPAKRISHILPLWELERIMTHRHLTESQVLKAMKKGVIKPKDAHDMLVDMGYYDHEAKILIESD